MSKSNSSNWAVWKMNIQNHCDQEIRNCIVEKMSNNTISNVASHCIQWLAFSRSGEWRILGRLWPLTLSQWTNEVELSQEDIATLGGYTFTPLLCSSAGNSGREELESIECMQQNISSEKHIKSSSEQCELVPSWIQENSVWWHHQDLLTYPLTGKAYVLLQI